MENFIKKYRVPGLAIAVTDNQRLLYTRYLGYADLGTRKPVTAETRFYLASIGKVFTGLCVLQLVEKGLIGLDMPVANYIPWFEVGDKKGEITIHQLLTHTSGLMRGTDFTPSSEYEIYALRFCKRTLEPGTLFHYSNVGYKVLGYVIEHVMGMPYQEVIQTQIIEPLGMLKTSPCLTDKVRKDMASGYETQYRDRPYCIEYSLDPAPLLELNNGDGCIVATAEDLCQFLRLFLNCGTSVNELIKPEMLEKYMFTPQVDNAFNVSSLHYSYGMTIDKSAEHVTYGHGGEGPGFKSCYLLDRDNGLAVTVFSNGPLLTVNGAFYILACFQASIKEKALPELPQYTHSFKQADKYQGLYHSETKTIELRESEKKLIF